MQEHYGMKATPAPILAYDNYADIPRAPPHTRTPIDRPNHSSAESTWAALRSWASIFQWRCTPSNEPDSNRTIATFGLQLLATTAAENQQLQFLSSSAILIITTHHTLSQFEGAEQSRKINQKQCISRVLPAGRGQVKHRSERAWLPDICVR